jgi:hypothetical protein
MLAKTGDEVHRDLGRSIQRQTVVVSGLLAYRMHRAAAARSNAIGREVLMLPQLAARLCGGFIEMAPPEVLFPLIRSALVEGGFSKFNDIAGLPGMPRAAMEALRKIWNADLDLKTLADRGEQMADLKRVEDATRAGNIECGGDKRRREIPGERSGMHVKVVGEPLVTFGHSATYPRVQDQLCGS